MLNVFVLYDEQKRGNDILALYRLTVQGFVPVETFLSRLCFFFSSLSCVQFLRKGFQRLPLLKAE